MSSYNRYPDEKGTERATNSRVMVPRVPVTTVTPMKRGLKGSERVLEGLETSGLQPLPR